MAALLISAAEAAILANIDSFLEEAFKEGVSDGNPTLLIESLLGYPEAEHQKIGEYVHDQRSLVKGPFKAALMAMLKCARPDWVPITLNSADGWEQSAAVNTASCSIDIFGRVLLRGAVQGGPDNTVVGTLPAGYAPTALSLFPAVGFISAAKVDTYVAILTNGNIVVPGSPSGTYSGLSLEGINYRVF